MNEKKLFFLCLQDQSVSFNKFSIGVRFQSKKLFLQLFFKSKKKQVSKCSWAYQTLSEIFFILHGDDYGCYKLGVFSHSTLCVYFHSLQKNGSRDCCFDFIKKKLVYEFELHITS